MSQWALLAFTLTSRRRKESKLYVEHTKHSIWKRAPDSNALPQRNAKTYIEREFFPFQRETLSKLMELQWEQKGQYLLLTSLWRKFSSSSERINRSDEGRINRSDEGLTLETSAF